MGRLENAIGWYHSHPGYGCWLSGIDVATQMLNQKYQEPWLAVVVRFHFRCKHFIPFLGPTPQLLPLTLQIDPTRTVSAGKVEIGAFRTYPEVES